MIILKRIIILVFLISQHNLLLGQADSKKLAPPYPDDALKKAILSYGEAVDESTALYNGVEYSYRNPDIKGTPFFNDDKLYNGSIVYDGQLYTGINLKYNIYKDILITDYYDAQNFFHQLQLIKEKIESFSWEGHEFIHIKQDVVNSGMPSGFYELLHAGQVRVLGRYTKSVKKNSDGGSQLFVFARKDNYYLQKDGAMIKVKKKRSVLEMMGDKEREIKAFMKKNKFRLKANPGRELSAIAAYYDELHEK